MKTVPILTGLLTIICIVRIVMAMFCLWMYMYKDLEKESENGENGEQNKKKEIE